VGVGADGSEFFAVGLKSRTGQGFNRIAVKQVLVDQPLGHFDKFLHANSLLLRVPWKPSETKRY
ncbi:hypothetical protein CEE86_14740, partial [Lactobacillus crispatus]